MNKDVQKINSLSRGLKILDIIHENGKIGVTELSKQLGVNKSSAYRLLVTLEDSGYVEQIAENGKYTLGLKLCKFQEKLLNTYDIRTISHPFLEELTSVTGESSGLSIRKNDKIMLIDCLNSTQHLGVILQVGDTEDFHCTAHAKALLYTLPEEEQRRLLSAEPLTRHTPHTLTSVDEVIAQSAINKERGYALDDEENTLGMRCVATNIYDFHGNAIASIGLSGPKHRISKEKMEEYVALVQKIGKQISQKLGY